MGRLKTLHGKYGDRAAFVFVYVTEAPHEDHLVGPLREHSPKATYAERRQGVREILEGMAFPIPCLFDREDGKVEILYDAWPQRLLVVGVDGKVVFDAGRGLQSRWNMTKVEDHLKAALLPSEVAGVW